MGREAYFIVLRWACVGNLKFWKGWITPTDGDDHKIVWFLSKSPSQAIPLPVLIHSSFPVPFLELDKS